MKIAYAITPTLLDAYLRFKRKDDDETFETLMCKINGVYQELEPEVQQIIKNGIDFENAVNNRLLGKQVDTQLGAEVMEKIVAKLRNNTGQQVYQEAVINTPYGLIKLYGIFDYNFPDMIVDLKTVVSYSCNKYIDYAQHPTYSLIRKLNGKPIKAFKYLITDFKRVYQETYIPNDHMYDKLMITIYEFIAFINHFKAGITNTKIFGK
jgi:hypothetical protein